MRTSGWSIAALSIVLFVLFALCISPALSQTCPDGCQCISEAKAKETLGVGNYQMCQKAPCGEEKSPNGASVAKFCIKPICPQGCVCMSPEAAKEKGLNLCSDQRIPCGYDRNQKPLYCFSLPTACPSGCKCLTEAQAKELGYNKLCQDKRTECGKDDKGYPKFCFQEPTPCPTGCICLTKEEALAKGLRNNCLDASGKPIICGVIDREKGIFKYCFKLPIQQKCVYDYNLGKCVGSCPDGTKCQLNTITHDPKTGKVTYAECHCK